MTFPRRQPQPIGRKEENVLSDHDAVLELAHDGGLEVGVDVGDLVAGEVAGGVHIAHQVAVAGQPAPTVTVEKTL